MAKRSRGTPRIANARLWWTRNYAASEADGSITLDIARAALDMAEVDREGLDKQDRRYLETLVGVFEGGPTGVEALAATMNLPSDTLSDEIEPYLLREQFIVRTPRGRVATPRAFTLLGRLAQERNSRRTGSAVCSIKPVAEREARFWTPSLALAVMCPRVFTIFSQSHTDSSRRSRTVSPPRLGTYIALETLGEAFHANNDANAFRLAWRAWGPPALAAAPAEPVPSRGSTAAGSTFVYPMMSKWSAEYDKAKSVEVNYQSIGSGGGIQQMTAKTADFGCTDGPMNEEQLKKAKEVGGDVFHIPLVMGAVVPAYNLEEVKEPLVFSGPVLADIFLGKIKKWNDKAIQDLNPGVAAAPTRTSASSTAPTAAAPPTSGWIISPRSARSGSRRWAPATSVEWPAGEGAKGNEGVAGRVKAAPGTIGYIELIYALAEQHQVRQGDE